MMNGFHLSAPPTFAERGTGRAETHCGIKQIVSCKPIKTIYNTENKATMKKSLTILLFSVLAIHASAQFKIHSNGYISFMTTDTPLSPISINCAGHANYFARYEGQMNGLYLATTGANNAATFYLTPNNTTNYALRSQIYNPDAPNAVGNYSAGVWGFGGYSRNNYGIVGTITKITGQYGVGVYGADNPFWYYNLTNDYAGYFDGDVQITDNLQVNGTIQGVLLGNSASANAQIRETAQAGQAVSTPTAERLSLLDLTTFTYPAATRKAENKIDRSILKADTTITEEMLREAEEAHKPTYLQKQIYAKQHYALDAEQLEEIFPDLVYEQEDGTKSINYMEMVPILVKTISELNGKIADLNDKLNALENGGTEAKARQNNTMSVGEIPASAAVTLRQNTPNPFSERTEIRFTLPSDVKNAFIYIFNMQGTLQKQIAVTPSMQSVIINGYELSPGMYIYSLIVNGKEIDTKRMIFIK